LDPIGLANSIYSATADIDVGRKGYAVIGKEREGRISFEDGIAMALAAFKKAMASGDPQTMLLCEYIFLSQENQFCPEADKETHNSLAQAIESFDDAFLVLKAVENPGYKIVDEAFPRNGKYRVKGCPKDSLHIACIAHKTRLQNILRTPGLDQIERDLLKQRLLNLPAAQDGYVKKQKKALGTR